MSINQNINAHVNHSSTNPRTPWGSTVWVRAKTDSNTNICRATTAGPCNTHTKAEAHNNTLKQAPGLFAAEFSCIAVPMVVACTFPELAPGFVGLQPMR